MIKTKSASGFRFIYMIIGLLTGLIFIWLPIKYAIVLVFGAAFAVFTLFNAEISYGMFIAGMAILPSGYWNNWLIVLSALFYTAVYALQWMQGKRKGIHFKYLAPSLVAYVLFCVISLFTGYGGMDSVRVFAILLGCIIHSVLVINFVDSKKTLHMFVFFLTAAIALTALYGLYQYAAGIEIKAEFTDLTQSQGLARLFSTMGNPNNDAEFWVMTVPFTIAMVLITKSDTKRLMLCSIVGLCVLTLMLTYSRSGYIALLAAAGVFILLACPRLVPVGILVFIIIIPFLPESLVARVMTIGKDTSSKYRLYIWEGVLRLLKDYWVQGIGLGPTSFTTIYRVYAHQSAGPAMHAHNVLLNVFVETGIGGFVAILLYLFKLFKSGISSVLNPKDRDIKIYAAAATASLTAFTVFSFVEYVWFYPRVMLCFWLISGLILAIARMNAEKETNESLSGNF